MNGVSIYTVAKNSPDPALKAIAADMDHANMPIGPVGQPTEQQNILNTYAYNYTKYPNAVREYLRFMWDKAAGRLLGDPVERIYRAAIAGLERQSDLDGRSEGDPVPRCSEIRAR